jgi:hypothetical protein
MHDLNALETWAETKKTDEALFAIRLRENSQNIFYFVPVRLRHVFP